MVISPINTSEVSHAVYSAIAKAEAKRPGCDCHKHERQVCDVCQGVTGRKGKGQPSDTVTVTPDGAIEVNIQKLLDKPHIKAMLGEIRDMNLTGRKEKDQGCAKS